MSPVLRRPYDMAFSTLNERDHALDKIEKTCRVMVKLYPAHFEFDFQRPEPGLFEMNVRRCFWRDFFARHDATPVTTVMCAFDVNFMKAIDPAVSGLRAERTSLLSLGDSRCRFAVLETDDPLNGYSDALETRFVDDKEGNQRLTSLCTVRPVPSTAPDGGGRGLCAGRLPVGVNRRRYADAGPPV
jgi:L-2-amino-thiazoline-4-carboxylic acid hydrolase-like protein